VIRVIYRWDVGPSKADAFIRAWREATRLIQANAPAARGSTLLRDVCRPDQFIAVARWDSLQAWEASRERNPGWVPPHVTASMQASASAPVKFEVFSEIADCPGVADRT
jgi:hypothetical protein